MASIRELRDDFNGSCTCYVQHISSRVPAERITHTWNTTHHPRLCKAQRSTLEIRHVLHGLHHAVLFGLSYARKRDDWLQRESRAIHTGPGRQFHPIQ